MTFKWALTVTCKRVWMAHYLSLAAPSIGKCGIRARCVEKNLRKTVLSSRSLIFRPYWSPLTRAISRKTVQLCPPMLLLLLLLLLAAHIEQRNAKQSQALLLHSLKWSRRQRQQLTKLMWTSRFFCLKPSFSFCINSTFPQIRRKSYFRKFKSREGGRRGRGVGREGRGEIGRGESEGERVQVNEQCLWLSSLLQNMNPTFGKDSLGNSFTLASLQD